MIFNPVIYGAKTSDLMYIYVDHLPDKTSYFTGENFDPTGMVIKGVTVDLVEVIIPNSDIYYLPPMPLRVGSELLRLLYTEPESGQTYGTTLSLDIKLGVTLVDYFGLYPTSGSILSALPIDDLVLCEVDNPIHIVLSEAFDYIPTSGSQHSIMPITETLAPRPAVARVIFEFDMSNPYITTNTSNQVVLNDTYIYNSTPLVIDSGTADRVQIITDDKVSVEGVVIEV